MRSQSGAHLIQQNDQHTQITPISHRAPERRRVGTASLCRGGASGHSCDESRAPLTSSPADDARRKARAAPLPSSVADDARRKARAVGARAAEAAVAARCRSILPLLVGELPLA